MTLSVRWVAARRGISAMSDTCPTLYELSASANVRKRLDLGPNVAKLVNDFRTIGPKMSLVRGLADPLTTVS